MSIAELPVSLVPNALLSASVCIRGTPVPALAARGLPVLFRANGSAALGSIVAIEVRLGFTPPSANDARKREPVAAIQKVD